MKAWQNHSNTCDDNLAKRLDINSAFHSQAVASAHVGGIDINPARNTAPAYSFPMGLAIPRPTQTIPLIRSQCLLVGTDPKQAMVRDGVMD
jgi:hypothetical protein